MTGFDHIADGLRIALFSGNYNYLRDGANQTLNRLVDFLQQCGADVRVYSPTVAEPDIPPNCPIVSVPSWPMPGGRSEYRLARGLPSSIRADLAKFDPHVFHTSAPDILGHRAVTFARAHQIPVVASVHTLFETYLSYYRLSLVEPALVAVLRRYYNRCDHLLVAADVIAERLRGQGISRPMTIWSRGVDHARFNPMRRDPQWRQSLGINDEDLVVGFLGRIVLEKGLDVFADVTNELLRRGVKHRVVMVGDGPARDDFARMAPHAIMAGFLTGDDLAPALASFDVLLNPSVTEGFGNVTLEAAASGVAVVAADAAGSKAIVIDHVTGRLVPPADITAFADAIADYAADRSLLRAHGAAAARHAAQFEWDGINAMVVGAYCDAIAAKLR